MRYVATNPHTGKEICSYPTADKFQLRVAIEQSGKAFESWKRTSYTERAEVLYRVAELLRANSKSDARLMAEEMGKPLAQGRGEIEKCAWACEYYAEHAERFLEDEPSETEAARSYVSYRPLGPVLAVMPWNFPFWQVVRFGAPALMAGNTILLKHAPSVPGCALRVQEIFDKAGLPEGCFQNLFLTDRQVGSVIRTPLVQAVTLTGSAQAGSAVAKQAGAEVKKTVLELGGSDPYVILEDADIEHAAEQCVQSRLTNSGQSCVAAKRFIVMEPVRERFIEAVVERMRSARVGDPLHNETEVGPLARQDLRNFLHTQVQQSIENGAQCLTGGEIPSTPGWYYPPTVLTKIRPGMPAYAEELFGPVASVLSVRHRKDAIRVANDTSFGLGAAVFTADVKEGERIAREELNAGCCFVNTFVKSDPRLPFGGTMNSGYGRELGRHGILEFANNKTIYVA
jgi:succinate-semialdehyde dehydrogenase/glutarate-semialdehyde dehydrogenase